MARRPADRDLWDPGAQPERTYQAWTRTALALTVCGLLATRLAHRSGWVALVFAGVVAVVALLVVREQKRRLHGAVIRSAPRSVGVLAGVTVALAAGALVVLLTPVL